MSENTVEDFEMGNKNKWASFSGMLLHGLVLVRAPSKMSEFTMVCTFHCIGLSYFITAGCRKLIEIQMMLFIEIQMNSV